MLYLEIGSEFIFIHTFLSSTTRLPKVMSNPSITIVRYQSGVSGLKVTAVPATAMGFLPTGEYYHLQDLDAATFSAGVTYFYRISAVDPVTSKPELVEGEFQVVGSGKVGLLNRRYLTQGEERAFSVDFRDGVTREPKVMEDVSIEIVYYTAGSTPLQPTPNLDNVALNFALAPYPMSEISTGRYVYIATIGSSFPPNSEFFVRYRGTDPVTGRVEVVEEVFSSFETTSSSGLSFFPTKPF